MLNVWFRQAWHETRETLQGALTSSATWFFIVCYLIATAYTVAVEGWGTWGTTGLQIFYLLFLVLTIFITVPMPVETTRAPQTPRARLLIQLAVIFFFVALTAYTALAFHGILSARSAFIPVWTPLLNAAAQFGEANLPAQLFRAPGNSIANPVAYFVIPLALLALLGARLPELGFGRGHRSWWVILLWCGIPVVIWAAQVFSGALNPMRLLTVLISNFFQNGFFEEFLFRGALQTRLVRLWNPAWALVIASLVFGLWHLGADVRQANGDWLGGIALAIRSQALLGIVFGVIFFRTRNLFACSMVHVVLNVFFQV